MMATKSTTSLRDRRYPVSSSPLHHSSSASRSARSIPKTSLCGGVDKSTPAAKKPVPNYLKPKNAPSSDPSNRRISTMTTTTTTSATSKTPSGRRPAEKAQSPSTPALQRSPKPPSPPLKSPIVARSIKTSPLPKAKSISPAPVKKKGSPVIIATTCPQVKLSSEHEAVMTIERPVQEQSWNDPKDVVEVLNDLKNVEESKFISSLIEEENHIEEQKHPGERLEPLVFDEVLKEPVVEERDEGKKVEDVEAVERRVESEVRKPRLGAAKMKDAPRSNDVIEETKSKLMGSRKNRVLALIGAFETVISLQEPEVQQNQKAHQVQNGQQIQQGQQVEQSFENKKTQQDVESRQNQEVRESQNAQELELGDEVHQDQPSQLNGENQENTILKELVNEALERGEEEEGDEALESVEKGEDAWAKEEEANEDLQNGKAEEHPMLKEEKADKVLQTSSTAKEESTEIMHSMMKLTCSSLLDSLVPGEVKEMS